MPTLQMPDALEVAHLSVSFGTTRVLDDLSFRVEAGQSLAIIGPNGSGRTVLFRALIGALPTGSLAAPVLHLDSGPLIITIAAGVFFSSLRARQVLE